MKKRGSTITLQVSAPDRRLTATVDTATHKATATLQLIAQGGNYLITDCNTANSTCTCK